MNKHTLTIVSIVAAAVLLLGCLPLPIGYYTFLRIAVFISSVICLLAMAKRHSLYAAIADGLLTILFNPILPIYLHSKTAWVVIDAVAAVWFIVQLIILKKQEGW
ncbi:MAG: hypothetical protein IJ761_01270 [Bacteroidales bacterium]|nr:hypothetical protein [Bacteroidales bacterium]